MTTPLARLRRDVAMLGGALIAGVLLAGTLAAIGSPTPAHAAQPAPTEILPENFPDPDILKVDDTYYAYSTNSGTTLPVASAPAPEGPWTRQEDEALTLPAWATAGKTWAPDVSRRADGKFLLYFTASDTASGRQCLGAAVADAPGGPFTPTSQDTPLVCDPSEGGEIDASSFVDTDGQRYLLYKNDGNAIDQPTTLWLQPVAEDGVTLTGERTGLISNDGDEGWLVEAPMVVKHGSAYVLFYSIGEYWNDTYATRYATASNIAGPYTKAGRSLMSTASFDGAVPGPGGADVVLDEEGGDRIFFHGVQGDDVRTLWVADVGWSADDTPIVRGSRVRVEGETGDLNNCEVRDGAAGASGGKVVARIDQDDSWVDLSVYAPWQGGYTVRAGYANGSVDDAGNQQEATHRVSVNDADAGSLPYPFTGWDTWQEATLDVELEKGWNTVRVRNGEWYAELDYLDVS